MKIKYIRAKNFLAVRDGPFEIDFSKYGNIVQIKGKNLDYGDDYSNGSGKTSCIEVLVYALYGKLIKGLNHKEAINVYAKRGLEVEVHFDEYKIIRRREPNELLLWENGVESTLGGIPATQSRINDIIGLNCEAFANVVCFGQHNERGFLRCTAAEKRSIAENLLSLDKYVRYHKITTDRRKETVEKIDRQRELYEIAIANLSAAIKRREVLNIQQEQWLRTRDRLIASLQEKINKQLILLEQNSNAKEMLDVSGKIKELDIEIKELDEKRMRMHVALEKADQFVQTRREEKQDLAIAVSNLERDLILVSQSIEEINGQIKESEVMTGSKCPVCYGDVTENNIKLISDHLSQKISERQGLCNKIKLTQEDKKKVLVNLEHKFSVLIENRKNIRDEEINVINSFNEKVDYRAELSKIAFRSTSTTSAVIEKDLENLQEQVRQKKEESSPLLDLIITADQELVMLREEVSRRRNEIVDLEKKIPYLDFWVKAFGDDGIRSLVIKEIMPALNSRISYWLQFLIENKVELRFNNQLEEQINPSNGDLFAYNALSGGEHQRIDLAIALGFAHVMMLTSGACPSIINLDEVGTNLDKPGIYAVFNTICELARDRQVLVITHHPVLQELLSNYDTIEVIRENGATSIKSKC